MSSLESVRLTFIDSVQEVEEFLTWLSQRRTILGCDTETRGLKYWEHPGDFCRLVQFADAEQGWSISVRKWFGLIEHTLKMYSGPLVGSNFKFDLNALRVTGLPVPQDHQIHDAMLLDQLLNPLRRHGLKEMAKADLHPRAGLGEDFLALSKKNRNWDWETIPEEALAYGLYGALDPVLSVREWEMWYPRIGDQREAYELEVAYSLICADMEWRGLRVDRSYLGRLRERWEGDIADLQEQLLNKGIEKPRSALQKIAALKREGWEPTAFTEKGTPITDKYVMEALKTDYETASLLLEFSYLKQRYTNYIVKMENEADSIDHIHGSFRVMGARTGRSSITNPPLHQLPKAYEVRRAIVPDEGHKLWAIDYAAEEFMLLIAVSQDPVALELIESGQDVHRWVASQAYGKPYEEISKDSKERQRSKNSLYASLYQARAAKVAATAGIEVAEAEVILRAINGGFNVMDTWRRDFTRQAELMDNPIIRVGDRWIHLPEGRVYTTAVNSMIQGLAAQVLKKACLRIKAAGLDQHLLVTMHDEGIFQLPDTQEATEISFELAELMRDNTFRPNLVTEITGPLDSWGAAYPTMPGDLD